MNQQSAMREIEVLLTNAIQETLDKVSGSNEELWEFARWVPPGLAGNMAKAAISVLENNADLNKYLEEQGQMK